MFAREVLFINSIISLRGILDNKKKVLLGLLGYLPK